MFGMYASAIVDIYDDNFDDAQNKLTVLQMNSEFSGLLKKYELPDCSVLEQYIQARQAEKDGRFSEALEMYTSMNFMDSLERSVSLVGGSKEQEYNRAQELFTSGDYYAAAQAFLKMGTYKDCAEKADEAIQRISIGSTVFFGQYEQDGNEANGNEEIEWIVIGKEGKALQLLSRKLLDVMPYNDTQTSVTWETCSLRTWLNSSFYDDAFDETEKGKILETVVSTKDNPSHGTPGGNDTLDKVYILSWDECQDIFVNSEYVNDFPYDYGAPMFCDKLRDREKYKIYNNDNDYNGPDYNEGCYFTRTPGSTQDTILEVYIGDYWNEFDQDVDNQAVWGEGVEGWMDCIRPVIWIEL